MMFNNLLYGVIILVALVFNNLVLEDLNVDCSNKNEWFNFSFVSKFEEQKKIKIVFCTDADSDVPHSMIVGVVLGDFIWYSFLQCVVQSVIQRFLLTFMPFRFDINMYIAQRQKLCLFAWTMTKWECYYFRIIFVCTVYTDEFKQI